MKTDHPIYQFLATGPEAFRVLTGGMTLPGPYRFDAPVLKGIERRIDGLFVPAGHDGPAYVVEFQGQRRAEAWYIPVANGNPSPMARASASPTVL